MREEIKQALKKVYDPEISVDIYELGLIYAVQEKIIDAYKESYSSVGHFKSLEDAKSTISDKSVGLILPKFIPSDIMKVVLNNDKMPQKSTYFYPKVATGLLLNKLY